MSAVNASRSVRRMWWNGITMLALLGLNAYAADGNYSQQRLWVVGVLLVGLCANQSAMLVVHALFSDHPDYDVIPAALKRHARSSK